MFIIAYLHVLHLQQSSFPVQCVHLKPFFVSVLRQLVGQDTLQNDCWRLYLFIDSPMRPCLYSTFSRYIVLCMLYFARTWLAWILVVCSPNLMFWSVVHCTFTGLLALAIVTVFKNSFLLLLQVKKKRKTEKECEMYVTYQYICNLVESLFNITYIHLFHLWTCCVQCVFDAIFFFLFISAWILKNCAYYG